MMIKSLVAAAAALGLLVVSSVADANIKVTPSGHLVAPSAAQQDELLHLVLLHHAPEEAQRIVRNAIWVDRKDADHLVITVTEDSPGEILPCIAVVSIGGVVNEPIVETKKGDGVFDGPGSCVVMPSGPTACFFHGASSAAAPMKLHIAIEWAEAEPR